MAIVFRLSKHLLTISKLETKVQLAPAPRTPYATYKMNKLFANEAIVKLSAQVRHPATDIARQPNRFTRELARGPDKRHREMDSEPIQAEKEENVQLNNAG